MLLRAVSVLVAVLVAACGQGAVDDGQVETTTTTTTTYATATQAPSPVVEPTETGIAWDGFAATANNETLAAYTHGPVDVYESPEASEPMLRLEGTTIIGSITVLAVVSGPEDGWAEVMLPVRPNGSTGWVSTDDVSFYVANGEIAIDLSDRVLTYTVDGTEVLRTDVGIGSEHNRTPTGVYFVTDNVTLADPTGPWGPHALGLSARSDTITEFNGGDGIIGIHGTNNPQSVGGSISLGCVRLPNDMIAALHEMVPLGTRVVVSA